MFPNCLYHLTLYQQCMGVPPVPYHLHIVGVVFFFFNFSHSNGYLVVIFICTFLIPNDDVCGLF